MTHPPNDDTQKHAILSQLCSLFPSSEMNLHVIFIKPRAMGTGDEDLGQTQSSFLRQFFDVPSNALPVVPIQPRLTQKHPQGHLDNTSDPFYGLAQPPATSTHSARHEPSLPSTSTISVSQRQRQPTPFSFSGSHWSQYSSSSMRFLSSVVVFSRYGSRGSWRAGAFAGQCWMVVCR